MTVDARRPRPGTPTRDRLLAAAYDLTEADGWGSVTMARVAREVGVSRQTVYNEFGTKHGLAQQLALHETLKFLEVARAAIVASDDLVDGLREACTGVLRFGETSVVIRSIAGPWAEDTDTDFLMLLTTESGQIVDLASSAVRDLIVDRFGPLPVSDAELDVAVEVVIRLVLSHLTRPGKSPKEAASDIAWLASRVLGVVTTTG